MKPEEKLEEIKKLNSEISGLTIERDALLKGNQSLTESNSSMVELFNQNKKKLEEIENSFSGTIIGKTDELVRVSEELSEKKAEKALIIDQINSLREIMFSLSETVFGVRDAVNNINKAVSETNTQVGINSTSLTTALTEAAELVNQVKTACKEVTVDAEDIRKGLNDRAYAYDKKETYLNEREATIDNNWGKILKFIEKNPEKALELTK